MRGLALLLLVLTLSTASAVDMRGKFGMGVGWVTGQDGLAPVDALTKYGLSERVVLEPTFYWSATFKGGGYRDSYSFGIWALFAYVLAARAKTNVYAKAGFGFAAMQDWEVGNGSCLLVPFGLGLEHFLSDHFSVDLSARMGLTFVLEDWEDMTFLTLGNEPVSAGLLWYY